MESDNTKHNSKSGNNLVGLIVVVVLIIAGIWLFGKLQDAIRPKSWTLFIYKSQLPNVDYKKARIDTYSSQTDCLEKGIALTSKGGSFECGYDCRYKPEYQEEICNKVCGQNGCRD